jgi:hypothetical protein
MKSVYCSPRRCRDTGLSIRVFRTMAPSSRSWKLNILKRVQPNFSIMLPGDHEASSPYREELLKPKLIWRKPDDSWAEGLANFCSGRGARIACSDKIVGTTYSRIATEGAKDEVEKG